MLRFPLLLGLLLCLTACQDDSPATPPSDSVPSGDAGIDALSQQLQTNPTAAAYVQRANLYYERGNFVDAVADLENALQRDSSQLTYYYALADAYLDADRPPAAQRTLERAERRFPDRLETYLRLGEVRLITQDYAAAEAILNRATELSPPSAEARYLLAQVYAERGDTSRALTAALAATRLDPDLTDGFLLLGNLAAARDQPNAADYFDAAVASRPSDPLAREARADYYYRQGDLPRAIAEYRQLALIDRQIVGANLNAGLLLLELDSLPQARAEFNIAVGNDPANATARYYRGYAEQLLGKPAAARRDYTTALRLDPNFTPAREALQALAE